MTMIELCAVCGHPHDVTRCQGHAKAAGGQQCGSWPVAGELTCARHRTRAAEVTFVAPPSGPIERKIKMVDGVVVGHRVENPLLVLQEIAGEAQAWKVAIGERVQQLLHDDTLRYATDGGEQIRGEILLWERAIDRVTQILAMIAKLNIDERLVKIAEGQKEMILAALEAGLAAAGLTAGPLVAVAKAEAARHLRVVPPPRQITAV